MKIILIRPEDIGKGRVFFYRDRIINEMRTTEELAVIGISNAISLACSSVQASSRIASIYIEEVCLDYIPIPVLGKVGGIFFLLSRKPTVDWESKKTEIEKDMVFDFTREGQLVVVSRKLSPEQMVPLCLSKLSKSAKLKIMSSGFFMNRVATLALEVTKGGISKGSVAIELITLSTFEIETPDGLKTTTALEIHLKSGEKTKYTKRHRKALSLLK